ncbi:MAG: penicillin-binding protein activator LpoB, partial [Treponema sp.]|nr:penicillin-binding protein activator LpoB [Treponema sp.]
MRSGRCVFCLAACVALFSCASSGGSVDGAVSLDQAIRASAERLGADLAGKRVAVAAFGSPSQVLSEYVIEELSMALANGRIATVVDRRELDLVRDELRFSLAGEVSDESAQRIGQMLGAQAVVSGSLADVGGVYRFRIKAINTESAAIESAPGFDVSKQDQRIVYLLNGAQVQAPQTVSDPQTVPSPQTEPAPQTVPVPQAEPLQRILPKDLAEADG